MRRGMSSIEILILVLIVGLAGYMLLKESPQSKNSGIVFVDLEQVFNALGAGQTMMKLEQDEISKLKAKRDAMQSEIIQRVDLIRKSFGDSPDETQMKTLAAVKKDGQTKLDKAAADDRAAIAAYRSKLMGDFRNSVKPFAKKAAAERGATTVMIADRKTLLACPVESLITDQVVKAILEDSKKENQDSNPTVNE